MPSAHHTYLPADEAATLRLGAALAATLKPGLVIYLRGDLGAGKTTFTRGLLRALGHQGPVKSPTYTLVELYVVSGYILYHFDFYRFNRPEEWLEAGLDEHFNQGTVCLVEWPEKAGELLPPADIEVIIEVPMQEDVQANKRADQQTEQQADNHTHEYASEQTRRITLNAYSERGTSCLSDLRPTPPSRRLPRRPSTRRHASCAFLVPKRPRSQAKISQGLRRAVVRRFLPVICPGRVHRRGAHLAFERLHPRHARTRRAAQIQLSGHQKPRPPGPRHRRPRAVGQAQGLVRQGRRGRPYIAGVRAGQFKARVVRLVFDLKSEVKPQVFELKPIGEYGHRLVLDLYPATPADPLLSLLDKQEVPADLMPDNPA